MAAKALNATIPDVNAPISALAPARLTLALDQTWNIVASCDGFLAPPRIVEVATDSIPGGEEVFLLRPQATFAGSLSAGADDRPDEVFLEIQYEAGTPGATRTIAPARLPCSLSGSSFSCAVPAGLFDARLMAQGFAPVYFWSAKIEAAKTLDIGRVLLHRGGSLSGWVTVGNRSPVDFSQPRTKLTLALQTVGGWRGNPSEGARAALGDHRTVANAEGFFQLTSLRPGAYVLTAERSGLAPADLPVTIGDVELRLASPLMLQSLANIDLVVNPPTAGESAWQARVLKLPAGSNAFELVEKTVVAMDGTWRSKAIVPGDYLLRIEDPDGSTWHEQLLSVAAGDPVVAIDLDLVAVRGVVQLGGEPLAATIVFGTTSLIPNVKFTSDGKGRFSGFLPHAGEWPVDVLFGEGRHQRARPVTISSSSEPVDVEIELPATRLAGRVVSHGRAVSDAFVVVSRQEPGARTPEGSLRVERNGEFEFLGLSPGSVAVRAYDRTRTSAWVRTQIDEGDPSDDLTLELGDALEVRGILTGPGGPVGGGLVAAAAITADGQSIPLVGVTSSVDGTFVLSVDARTTALDAIALVPGCGIQLGRYAVASSPSFLVAIDCPPMRGELVLQAMSADSTLVHGGAVLSTAGVLALAERGGFLTADEQGFRLAGVPLGHYRFCAGGTCREGDVGIAKELVFGPVEAAHADSR